MKRKQKSGSPPTQQTISDAINLAVGVRLAETAQIPVTVTALRTEDMELASNLGFQFLILDMDLTDQAAGDAWANMADTCPASLTLYVKVRIPQNIPPAWLPDDRLTPLARSFSHRDLHWILDPPHKTSPPFFSEMLAERLRRITPSSRVGLWFPCSVFVPDDPESPWDTRAARNAAAKQLAWVPDPELFDFLVLVWQGVVIMRFSPFRPFARWQRLRQVHPPDPADTAFFTEAVSMTAALRRPMLVVDSSSGPLRSISLQATGHCASLGTFFGETADTTSLLGYCWSPFLAPVNETHSANGRTGLVMLDPKDGSRTPHPETFRWTATCRQAFREARMKGTAS